MVFLINAQVQFLNNMIYTDLSVSPYELQRQLQSAGILTVAELIRLDNARTLQIHLSADNELGKAVLSLVNKNKDTLGMVNQLCNYVCCMNCRIERIFRENLQNGRYNNLGQALKAAEKVRSKKKNGRSR